MRKGDVVWLAALGLVLFFMLSPMTRESFGRLSLEHPYLLGFAKFFILATMGELLAIRIKQGRYAAPSFLPARAVIWGFVGVLIVYFFTLFPAGIRELAAKRLLPIAQTGFWPAFFISASMNSTFGIAFMAGHRISDALLDVIKHKEGGLSAAVASVDWNRFFTFVVGKTIPLFWIPAHTLTFLLPAQYRVLVAALLSIALGLILSLAARKKT